MVVRIGSNISSLVAQRSLANTTDSLSATYERLSSGMRINRASDDAAGLAIASSLRADSRVFAQGMRNLNDGISYLSIADGAISELSKVITRQSELASQAANGTFSTQQRLSLQAESDALTKEFNRIVSSTSFNGRDLFDTTNRSVRLQLGYGVDGSIDASFISSFERRVGDGTYTPAITLHNEIARKVFTVDIDNDGDLDLVNSNDNGAGNVSVSLNNGNGTFAAATSLQMGNGVIRIDVGDINGDGYLDLVSVGSNIGYRLGNGNGTFSSVVTAAKPASFSTIDAVRIADFNGDGIAEIAAVGSINSGNPSNVLIYSVGSGTLTLTSQLQYNAVAFGSQTLEIGDLNGDGQLDIVNLAASSGVSVFYGNGDGSFRSVATVGNSSETSSIGLADFDRDGDLDVMTSGSMGFRMFYNNGNGTFRADGVTHAATLTYLPDNLLIRDLNGDGLLDAAYLEITDGTTAGSYLNVIYGNADGTFSSLQRQLLRTPSTIRSFTFGDTDGDGVDELVVGSNGTAITIFEQNLKGVNSTQYLNLLSAEDARTSLDLTRTILNRLAQARGAIGSNQSRLNVALANLAIGRENYISAESRITDADIGLETSELVRKQILQNVAASILGQANLQPSIAIKLLKG